MLRSLARLSPLTLRHPSQPHPVRTMSSSKPSSDAQSLPAPSSDGTTTIDVSGEGTTVKLDALGPLVVNTDGSMARVSNWAEMTEIERQNTLRILGKRNQARLAALRKKEGSS